MTSILDQHEQASQVPKYGQSVARATPLTSSGYVTMQLEEDVPIFNKQKMNFNPSDTITRISVSSDYLVLTMANNTLFRIDLKKPDVYEDISLAKYVTNNLKLTNVFLDPLGFHMLVSLGPKESTNAGPELLYLHRKSTKIKPINKSKNFEVTQVAWNFDNQSESLTGSILLGTSKGLILETEINSDGDKIFQSGIEQYWRQLPNYFPLYGNRDIEEVVMALEKVFSVGKNANVPITGIEFRKAPNTNKYIVFVTTQNMLYLFTGSANYDDKPLFQSIFNAYLNVPEEEYTLKIHSDLPYCPLKQLDFFCDKKTLFPKTFGWLTENAVIYGEIDALNIRDPKLVLNKSTGLSYPKSNVESEENKETPLSFIFTEFHGLYVYEDHIKAVSLLNNELIYEDYYPDSMGRLKNIIKDPVRNTIWAITNKAVFRYKVYREQRNVWQVYMEKNQFDLAKKFCENNPAHLDKICVKEAEILFEQGEYKKSAELFAATQSTFEGVCLKFMNAQLTDALQVYLMKKLETLKSDDKIQTTMLVVWLIELYLSRLNQMRYSGLKGSAEFNSLQKDFESFLTMPNVNDCIETNNSVIYKLMASHGDKDNLIKLNDINKDFENVIRQNIYKKSYYDALQVLKTQRKRELFYQFAPILMQEIPGPTVTALIEQGKNLNPTILLKAFVFCDSDAGQLKELIRYLEYCVHSLGCTDQVIHNYLLSLYVKHDKPALMTYLKSQGQTTKTVLYDIHYALRMCQENELTEACVILYTILGLWESAVELALTIDVEIAKNIADTLEDLELKKNMWLNIAKHEINRQQDIKQAMEFLQQCDMIKIEDILPFFSNLVTIDNFREPICESLQKYNTRIKYLKEDMEEATKSSEQVRADIQSFHNRSTLISVNEPCILCEIKLVMRPFYLFPCGHKFHSDCLMNEVQGLLGPAKRNKLENLFRHLNSHYPENAEDTFSGLGSREHLQNEIDNILSSECLYCGEYMIQSIDMPFISDEDWFRVMKEWE